MPMELKVLKAKNGDCIWIRFGEEEKKTNIIIDSGPKSFQNQFKKLIDEIKKKGEDVDLLVISHIDDDHIGGFYKWIVNLNNDPTILKKVWFNTGKSIKEFIDNPEFNNKEYDMIINGSNQQYSPKSGLEVAKFLSERNVNVVPIVKAGDNDKIGNAKLTVLSPTEETLTKVLKEWGKKVSGSTMYSSTKFDSRDLEEIIKDDDIINDEKFIEDPSAFNGASIAFVFEYNGISLVFLGDAYADTIIKEKVKIFGDKPLEVHMLKLSHHGSSSNTNMKLLAELRTNNFIVTSNGANNNPDKQTIARILKSHDSNSVNLYCNYNWWSNRTIFTQNDIQKYISTNKINRIELTAKSTEVTKGLVIAND